MVFPKDGDVVLLLLRPCRYRSGRENIRVLSLNVASRPTHLGRGRTDNWQRIRFSNCLTRLVSINFANPISVTKLVCRI